jgi:phenylacetate-CoA ligase
MNSTLSKNIIKSLSYIRKQPIWESLDFLEISQWWSRDEIKNYQEKKLHELLLHCSENVPFYVEWFKKNQCGPDDITLSNLNQLPVIEKDFLRNNLDILCSKAHTGPYEQAKTSGSTGVSLHFPKSLKASGMQLAAMYRGHRWHGVEPGAKEARLWGIPVNRKSRMKIHLVDFFLNRFRERKYNLTEPVLADFHKKMISRKPEYLMGYTSMVVQYAKYLKNTGSNGRDYKLKMVKCTSETIHDSDRDIIEDIFGCPLVSEYGAAETGLISFQCEKGCHHLMSECSIIEFIGSLDNLTDEDLKEVVVTNLDNYTLPIVRYKVGDLAVPSSEQCRCGRKLPLIEKVTGRVSDIIKSSDGRKWHSIIIYYIMKGLDEKYGGVLQFRVYQHKLDNLDFMLVCDGSYTINAEKYIFEKCKNIFGDSFSININYAEFIPREKSGKFRDFVSIV